MFDRLSGSCVCFVREGGKEEKTLFYTNTRRQSSRTTLDGNRIDTRRLEQYMINSNRLIHKMRNERVFVVL